MYPWKDYFHLTERDYMVCTVFPQAQGAFSLTDVFLNNLFK